MLHRASVYLALTSEIIPYFDQDLIIIQIRQDNNVFKFINYVNLYLIEVSILFMSSINAYLSWKMVESTHKLI